MVRPMKEEWAKGAFTSGGEADQGGKVHCVRRFGLDRNAEEEEEQAAGEQDVPEEERARRREAARRRRHMVRHITAVDMSEHNAEDDFRTAHCFTTTSPVRGKRRRGSSGASRLQRTGHLAQNGEASHSSGAETSPLIGPTNDTSVPVETEEVAGVDSGALHQVHSVRNEAVRHSNEAPSSPPRTASVEPQTRHVYGSGISAQDMLASPRPARTFTHLNNSDMPGDETDDEASEMDLGTEVQQDDEGMGEDDDDDDDDDYDDEDEDDEMNSSDEEELEAILADEEEGLYPAEDESTSPFSTAPVVYPRRLFKGARNVETVKDVTFLGAMSDKVGSGSDDGNFFVWDKATGKLEGIWEGDSSVVNVIEQHPSLPLCAVSGIDSTVKLFAPLHKPPARSYQRIANAENIIRANTQSDRSRGIGGRMALLSSYARFLAQGGGGLEEAGEDGEGLRDCALQ
ncbi:hypothetical protein QFC24_006582 [Naganishia onofrii]|uniref:Uncharacterized protein n=1 Tax=Naganishia onofrii TaxID=1851511 RepID=A0ACC2X078_9TREE|nr:hypothetical protein QFC24_006582 [Naganishia onofrii]